MKVSRDGVISISLNALHKELTTISIKTIVTNDMAISCRLNGYKAYDKNFK